MTRTQNTLFAALLAVNLMAWAGVFWQYRYMTETPMAEMWMPPSAASAWSAFDFGIVFLMWAIMMTAMMLPSAFPTVMAFTAICRRRGQNLFRLSSLFVLGYLSIWTLFSIVLALLQWQMHGLLWLSPMMDNNNRVLAIAILTLAGAYQFSPTKNACLSYCQSPVGFLMNRWRDGAMGAYRMGTQHGVVCLGCCWAEMLVMFSVGLMNITGMLVLTLIITLEKLSPFNAATSARIGGLLFFAWAGGVMFSG